MGDGFDGVIMAATLGRQWACERIYRDLAPTVFGYLRLQGAAEPEDLTSEVFIGVFAGLRGFSGTESQFRSWVFTIAHRRLVDDRRRRGRQFSATAALYDRRQEPAGGDVEEDALRAMSAERVRTLCATLAPDQRDVLLLRMVSDLTVEQIAAVLDRSPGAVKALQRRGLAALRHVVAAKSPEKGVPL